MTLFVQGSSGGKLSVRLHQKTDGQVWLYNTKGKSHVGTITPNWIQEIAKMAMG